MDKAEKKYLWENMVTINFIEKNFFQSDIAIYDWNEIDGIEYMEKYFCEE